MDIVAWVVLGAITGYVVNMIAGRREGLIGTVILGVVGGLVGGFASSELFHRGNVNGLNVESVLLVVAGAVVVLFGRRLLASRRTSHLRFQAAAHLVLERTGRPNLARHEMLWSQTHAIDVWRFKSQAHAMGGRRHQREGHDAGAARDGGLWRGLRKARSIVQLRYGAPPPPDSALRVVGLVAHG
jgi:uncharacterized membrane protein YeaQ/YmgE (transglycosylase-associated protein family)